jgi:hypothetical protein
LSHKARTHPREPDNADLADVVKLVDTLS